MEQKPVPAALSREYRQLLETLKARIRAARVKAVLSVNREMIALYWDLGRQVVERQRKGRWGTGIIERLSQDIRMEFPGIKGFSPQNIWHMRAFYHAWPKLGLILPQPVGELGGAIRSRPMSELSEATEKHPVVHLPWGHNIDLLENLTTPSERLWYANQALRHGWSRNVLAHQIESGLYSRQGTALTNFKKTLASPQSDLAQETIKDDYVFDFLASPATRERDLEKGLLDHVQRLLLELGTGFALVGRQQRLEVGGEEFYIVLSADQSTAEGAEKTPADDE